jgi:hypothetical protein
MLKEALQYSGLGFSIIPIQPKGKKPLIPWEEYQKTRASESAIKLWWKKWPDANVGIVTGEVSGIAVVDLEYEGLAEASRIGLRSVLTSITGKGRHLYFKHPGEKVCNAIALRKIKGLDIRGDGGYCLAPPSIHPDGKKYTWITPPQKNQVLSDFPLEILSQKTTITTTEDVRNPQGWIAEAIKGAVIGNRDETLFRICSRLRADNYSPDDARTLLLPIAEGMGKTSEQLDAKISNVWNRYSPNRIGPIPQTNDGQSLTFRTIQNSKEEYHRRKKQRSSCEYPSGFPKLDRLIGGYQRSEIFTVAALPGTGKTNFAIATSVSLCRANKRVVFLSTEMSFDRIWDRFITASGNSGFLDSGLFSVCDEFTPDMPRIESALREHGPDIFIFDHINHVSDEHTALGDFMRGLKGIARKFNIPGIVMAELNRYADFRENGKSVPPRMSMIKGSGTIEQASAQILLLTETSVQPDQNEVLGVLDKNRYGDRDNIGFLLLKNPYRFVEQPE